MIRPDELQGYTLREINNAITGYFDKEDRAARVEYECTRLAIFFELKGNGKLKSTITPEKLLPFSWDKKERIEIPDDTFNTIVNRLKRGKK